MAVSREEIKNRRVDPTTFAGKFAADGSSVVVDPGGDIPMNEPLPPVAEAHVGLAAKLAARKDAVAVVPNAIVLKIVDEAYLEFLKKGYGAETARSLAQTYAVLELAVVLNGIIAKL